MFIRFFKTNQPAAFFALPLLAMVFWMRSWLHPIIPQLDVVMPFYSLLAGINHYTFFSEILAFIVVLLQAFYLNHLINKYDLRESRERANFLAAFFCIFFLSLFPEFRSLLPQHFSGLFLLLMTDRIFDSYRKEKAFSNCFDAGLYTAVASLFYFPSAVFLILIYAGFIILRPFNWREWIITLIGFVVPWLFVFTWYFWFNHLGDFINQNIAGSFSSPYFEFGRPENAVLIFFFTGLFSIPAGMNFMKLISSGKVKTNKFFILFLWFLFLALVSGLVFPIKSYSHFSLIALPLAIVFSNWFLSLRKYWLIESLYLVLLGAFIYAEFMIAI